MVFEHTQQQSSEEQQRAQALSLNRSQPPAQVPGYEPRRFLGAGAYGEVWVALDRNTGRQVAIKFYAHRGGLDWSLLSREVEKLAFLSADRYVVQLLDVGWDSEPPYYVMEYIERGSLEQLLRRDGKLPVAEAVLLFHEVAVGLLHAHGKGVMHCDLKPANVLLDQDSKPRLADFGQSRLTSEQTPALGTLFYMAPEQADLKAMPDVRWDVYALGALLYSMLTGVPPYRSDQAVTEIETAADLDERLTKYRDLIAKSPRPSGHRQISGVDRTLADIVDRCLTPDRNQRFANVQEVLDALEAREERRARRPLVVLGAFSPALILAIMSFFAWRSFETIVGQTDDVLRMRAIDRNHYAAQYVAKTVTSQLDRRYRAVEEMSTSHRFEQLMAETLKDSELAQLRTQLSDPQLTPEDREPLREQFLAHPARQQLQVRLEQLKDDAAEPAVSSWFVTDENGLQLARAPVGPTIGVNFAWRTYFHGRSKDEPDDWRPEEDDHVTQTNLSDVFQSEADERWVVSITAPVVKDGPEKTFLGLIGMAVKVERFIEFQEKEGNRQFAVLVDWRDGKNKGRILQHPLFSQVSDEENSNPDRFDKYRVRDDQLPDTDQRRENYKDPLADYEAGADYREHWMAGMESVIVRDQDTGWRVIVQESYEKAIGETLSQLKKSLLSSGLAAVALIAVLSTALWFFVIRMLGKPVSRNRFSEPLPPEPEVSL